MRNNAMLRESFGAGHALSVCVSVGDEQESSARVVHLEFVQEYR